MQLMPAQGGTEQERGTCAAGTIGSPPTPASSRLEGSIAGSAEAAASTNSCQQEDNAASATALEQPAPSISSLSSPSSRSGGLPSAQGQAPSSRSDGKPSVQRGPDRVPFKPLQEQLVGSWMSSECPPSFENTPGSINPLFDTPKSSDGSSQLKNRCHPPSMQEQVKQLQQENMQLKVQLNWMSASLEKSSTRRKWRASLEDAANKPRKKKAKFMDDDSSQWSAVLNRYLCWRPLPVTLLGAAVQGTPSSGATWMAFLKYEGEAWEGGQYRPTPLQVDMLVSLALHAAILLVFDDQALGQVHQQLARYCRMPLPPSIRAHLTGLAPVWAKLFSGAAEMNPLALAGSPLATKMGQLTEPMGQLTSNKSQLTVGGAEATRQQAGR
eukprot:evm.model.scf_3022.1 EVM.evm.TU.scf_3022.1   scf_3022:174-4292(+)